MEVFRDIDSLGKYLSLHKCKGQSIGLVPTMGALHQGHVSLLEHALRENDLVICSVYVNPAQFNNTKDLKEYPRQETTDLELLSRTGCHAVFVPNDEIMYVEQPLVNISFGELDRIMEGEFRPGHFNGVALVVSKLLNAVGPDRTYFGQKDLQQYLLIRRMVNDLGFRTELRCVPIFREESGLAMSSRNMRLNGDEKIRAASIYRMLQHSAKQLKDGIVWEVVCKDGVNYLKENGLKPEYFEAVNAETLVRQTNDFTSNRVALCVAAFAGDIRLIDNLILGGS